MIPKYLQIDLKILPVHWLPIALRKPRLMAYFLVAFSALRAVYQDFVLFYKQTAYKLSHTSSAIHLRKVLNDKYDPVHRRILIASGAFQEPIFFANRADDKPVYFGRQFFKNNDIQNGEADFIALFPREIRPKEAQALSEYLTQANGLIDYYKLASKTHIIKWTQ